MLTEFTITILTSHDPEKAENEIRTAILAAGYVIEDFVTGEVEGGDDDGEEEGRR